METLLVLGRINISQGVRFSEPLCSAKITRAKKSHLKKIFEESINFTKKKYITGWESFLGPKHKLNIYEVLGSFRSSGVLGLPYPLTYYMTLHNATFYSDMDDLYNKSIN